MMENKILIIDSDISLKKILVKALKNSNTLIDTVSTLSEAWIEISKKHFDLVITDVELSDGDGLELVEKIKKKKLVTKIIVISKKNNLLTAVRANELDVYEYLTKPIDLNDLTIVVNRAFQKVKKFVISQDIIDEGKLPIIGNSIAMQNVYKTIAKLMKTDLTVLISGESGTGKELVAKAIHDFSPRSKEEFIVLNMAAIPKELIESELFGYEKGAFTGADKTTIGFFEKAEGGTLFLDEIGDMPFDIQARLLRVLQIGEFTRVGGRSILKSNVRIISATNKNLKEDVEAGLFREDLFYRLNVVNINVPSLRKRKSDILLLSNYFLNKFSKSMKKLDISSNDILENYSWPGNVRELENLFKKISVLYSESVITKSIISEELENHYDAKKEITSPSKQSISKTIDEHLEDFFSAFDKNENDTQLNLYNKLMMEFEKPLIKKTLEFCGGNQIKASMILGINRNTLRKKIKTLKIIYK
ncbi:MAG: nitrogen regulation protein NR(I) [Rickettsiales bacterium]|nr:nitrogen regulation protein NR(I) [Rickettsiales bacterium]|tara:strand:- start:2963 stop:4387 length:1425 start_codon:yes stop_codon:yes gene_type:complete